MISPVLIEQSFGNIERHMPNLPSWLKGAAKLLNGASENQDWLALAKIMGETLDIGERRRTDRQAGRQGRKQTDRDKCRGRKMI